jgi:hypothetical protein
MSGDDYCTRIADQREQNYCIAVHSVEENQFVSYDRDELEDNEESGGEDGVEV